MQSTWLSVHIQIKSSGLEGEDSKNVISAVDMLREIGDGATRITPENVSLS